MAARGVGSVKKDEGNGVVATNKYCAKAIEDNEDDDEVNENEEDEEEENRVGTEAQGNGDGLDVFEALFKPLSSSQATAAARHSCHCHRWPTTVSTNFSLGLTHHHTSYYGWSAKYP
jgi:hypothetical protein